ncbi:extracellular solute-binding protein [Nocardioides panacis]|uniref:Extracellular solute-binding protein n=1 Tax=Nocardioides panacis TaxID=2849501 RepID=A0A975T3F0_9ACTN|nr:extracellular solute-binding protein [Nocardioides panacis]QWZ10158.1 extracellular solute-binding protein [Nocardioides panacis]
MKKKALIIPAAVMAVVLSACGSPTASSGAGAKEKVDSHAKAVFDKFNGMTGQERADGLLKAAQDEGEVSLYTSNTDMDAIVDGFMDKYDIDVNVYRGNSESVLQRILQESKAGFAGADLIETNSGELNVIGQEGLFYPYKGEYRDAVRPEGQKETWTADRFNAFAIAYNTDKVKGADIPTSLEQFADPKWKGKISMEVGDVDWFSAMFNYYLKQGKSEQEVTDLFKKIAANAKIVKGHTVQAELLSAGEFAAGLSMYTHSVQEGTEEGRPIAWRTDANPPAQPIVIRPNGAGLLGTAKHPAAAMLFTDYLLTDGQKDIADAYRIGSVPGADDPLAGLETIEVDEDEMLNNAKKWDDLYADILEGGKVSDK